MVIDSSTDDLIDAGACPPLALDTCLLPPETSPPSNCVVDPNEPAVSAIPGNIGIVKAKVIVWDHDPFLSRPHQEMRFPFTQFTSTKTENSADINVVAGAAYLHPQLIMHDMFIATINPNLCGGFENPGGGQTSINSEFDFVGSSRSGVGQIAESAMPGGVDYETDQPEIPLPEGIPGPPTPATIANPNTRWGRDIFPHQVWIHLGSLLKKGVAVHPSEYGWSAAQLFNAPIVGGVSGFTPQETTSAARWDYTSEDESGSYIFTPKQTVSRAAAPGQSVHWALEKFTPVWQGYDFFVTIWLGEAVPDTTPDIEEEGCAEGPQVCDNGVCPDGSPCETEDEFRGWGDDYKYLLYKSPTDLPQPGLGTTAPEANWTEGISNAAFFIAPDEGDYSAGRKQYWFKHKTYFMVEVGAGGGADEGNRQHHYFIEIVKGRNPRLLHLGKEWDNWGRLSSQGAGELDPEKWEFVKKCRVLSVWDETQGGVSSDALFKQKSIRFSVRNHSGRFVITFEGYEGSPWVITRRDRKPQAKQLGDKEIIPVVIPAGKIRIFGGNLKATINISPMKYVPNAIALFENRQVDAKDMEVDDIWLTFSHTGRNKTYRSSDIKTRDFNDVRIPGDSLMYDCDAYEAFEIHRDFTKALILYEDFESQYKAYGKGFVVALPSDSVSSSGSPIRDADSGLYPPHKLQTTWHGDNADKGHKLELFNANFGVGGDFPKTLIAGQHGANYPWPEHSAVWNIGVRMTSGTVLMPLPSGFNHIDNSDIMIDTAAKPKPFGGSITPVVPSWRMMVLGGSKPVGGSATSVGDRNVQPFDIAPLVTSITDGWTVDGYSTANHEAQLKCYIPVGPPVVDTKSIMKLDPDLDPEEVSIDFHSLGQKLLELRDKAFYVTISYWWSKGVGARDAIENDIPRSGPPEDSDLLIQMTGIAYGAEIEKMANRMYMNFTVQDYMSAFKKQFIFNSPFFDAVSDVLSVYELAKMAGFDDLFGIATATNNTGPIKRAPLGYLQEVINNERDDGEYTYNGEENRTRAYDLPGSYSSLTNPKVKFGNGETYESALKKIALLSSKMIYFDRWGVLKMENPPAVDAAFTTGTYYNFKPVYRFYTTPFPLPDPPPPDPGSFGNPDGLDLTAARKLANFKPRDPAHGAAHLVWDVVKTSRSVEDCVNQIVLLTASNDITLADGRNVGGGLIVEGFTFFDQIWDPTVEGFFGFRKPFYQSNGVFGGLENVRNALTHYARMRYPPSHTTFMTYGVPGLKALDIISLDNALYYITEINHEIDPSENKWWMTITGEWLKPFLGTLGLLHDKPEEG